MDMRTDQFAGRAQAWLDSTYGGLVVPGGTEPIRVTERGMLFDCRHAEAREPMLAATVCVPMDGRPPFPVSNAEPLNDDANLAWVPGVDEAWRWRVNARNCVVALDVSMGGAMASACAWRPADESPGWWDRLLSQNFPAAEVANCSTWAEVGDAIVDGGPGTHGVVWLRRHLDGRDLTGHLLYARYDEEFGTAIAVDPQLGALATVTDREAESLVLARFHRLDPLTERLVLPWDAPANDFAAAMAKATAWLDHAYSGQVRLVEPNPDDEGRRGWLFACTTARFAETGDWREQMLDAALMVPKATGESPFGLPNRNPWTWLRDWDDGAADLPAPPAPGAAAWWGAFTGAVGTLHEANQHEDLAHALNEVAGFPPDSLALIWMRRKDYRNRETVGHLLWVRNFDDRLEIVDPTAVADEPPVDANLFELRVFRVGSRPGEIAGSPR